MSMNGRMEMSAADRINGSGLVMKSVQLSLVGFGGVLLGSVSENAWGIFKYVGTAAALLLILAYLAGVVILYSKAGVWKFIGVLAVRGAAFPWKVTRIIVFSWMFFFIWAALSMCLVWLVVMTAVTAPWLVLLLARRMA